MIHKELIEEGFTPRGVLYHMPHGAWAQYLSPEGEECMREVTPADEVEVSSEYVMVDIARCGCSPARVWVTTYADGRQRESKCGHCYL